MRDKAKILALAKEHGAEGVIVIDNSTRHWLTGFRSSAGFAVVWENETALFLDPRYTEKAYSENPDCVIYPCLNGITKEACEYIKRIGLKSVLVDEDRVTLGEFESLKVRLGDVKLRYGKGIFEKFISQKTEFEISLIKQAVKITDECFSHMLGIIRPGITESDVASEIDYFFHKRGCENAFETIAVSGVKSSMPHGTPDTVRLTENSFLTMDFGAKYKGYCSDLTRTVVLGKADEEMKSIYNTVLEANLRGINAAKCGVPCMDVDKAARDFIAEKGFGECFGHSTGHSLGVEIHEFPSVSKSSEATLIHGNVITVEPGIYIPKKYGVRIEDTVLILENETVVLSSSPKNLIEI